MAILYRALTAVLVFNIVLIPTNNTLAQSEPNGVPIGGCKVWVNGHWEQVPCNDNTGNNVNISPRTKEPTQRQRRIEDAKELNHLGIDAKEKARNCWPQQDWNCAIFYFRQAIDYYTQANDKDKDKIYRDNLTNNETNLAEAIRLKSLYDAKTYMDAKQYEQGVTAYREYTSKYPNNAEGHYNLCIAFWNLAKYEEAYNECKLTLAIDPSYPGAAYSLDRLRVLYANQLNQEGIAISVQYKEAELLFAKAASLDPQNKDILMNLGFIQDEQHKYADAEATYRKALALAPDDMKILFRVGQEVFSQNRLKEAEDIYRKTTLLYPQEPDTYYSLALVLGEEKIDVEAEMSYKKSIQLGPNAALYHNYYGGFLEKRGRYAEAALEFEHSIMITPVNNWANEELVKLIQEGKIGPQVNGSNQLLTGPSLQKATDDAITGVYKNSPAGVSERIRKGFQAVQVNDWEVAKAWFQDAALRDPNNTGIRNFINLCSFSTSLQKASITNSDNKIAISDLTDQEKNLLNVWIGRVRESAKKGDFMNATSDMPASALDKVRKYVYGLSNAERDKLFFPDDFMMDLLLHDMMK